MNSPEFWAAVVAILLALAGLITALSVQIRTNANLKTEREKTENDIKRIRAQSLASDDEHRRQLELMRLQVETEQLRRARETEDRLENDLKRLLEGQLAGMQTDLTAIKEERQRLRQELSTESEARKQLATDVQRERELRQQLEDDFTALKSQFEALQTEKQMIQSERDSLRKENHELRERLKLMARLQEEIEEMRAMVAEQQREIRTLQQKTSGNADYDDDLPPAEDAP